VLQAYQLLPEAKIVCDLQRLWLDSRKKRPKQTAEHCLSLLLNRQEADVVQCRQWKWPLRITIFRNPFFRRDPHVGSIPASVPLSRK